MENNGVLQRIISTAMDIPGVRVDYEDFLRKELKNKVPFFTIEKAVEKGTAKAGISKKLTDGLAKNTIRSKKAMTVFVSALAGIPGGVAGLLGGTALDTMQFYANFLNLTQRLMYIYGYGDIASLDAAQEEMMIVMLGAAMGVEAAQKFVLTQLPKLAGMIGDKIIAREATKSILTKVSEKVLIQLGLKEGGLLTTEEIARYIAKAVPVVGAVINGSISWIMFSIMAKNLQKVLSQSYDYRKNWSSSEDDDLGLVIEV